MVGSDVEAHHDYDKPLKTGVPGKTGAEYGKDVIKTLKHRDTLLRVLLGNSREHTQARRRYHRGDSTQQESAVFFVIEHGE